MRDIASSSAVILALAAVTAANPTVSSHDAATTGATYASGFDMTTSWANLSPYRDAAGFNVSNGVPHGCELSQVHVLHRHAQRWPTPYPLDGEGMEDFGQKVVNYTKAHPHTSVGSGPLAFLNHWKYLLGEDLLTANGASTEATSGANFWNKYGRLLYRANTVNWDESLNVYPNGTARPKPVFRTTSQARILESARWWLSGFFNNIGANSSYSQYDLVIIPEVDPFNNTLASYDSCPGDMGEGDASSEIFIPKSAKDAVARLSRFLPADFNLTALDVLAMQNLCVYETTSFSGSAFCSLFTEQEWRDYEYMIDLQFYGDYGFGSPTGRAQGIGYVLELAARLQAKLIYSSDTSINYTYDDNTAQFPLNQPFYMDMSHDDIIVSVITALGLQYFNYGPDGLPANITHAPANRTFNLNQITPFGARFMTEVWTCPQAASLSTLDPVLYTNPDFSHVENTTDYIRFVLNGAPVPLDGIETCNGPETKTGFCAVKDFLKAVPTMKQQAMYQDACFGNYTSGHQVEDGHPERDL
ncbi:hypothetical protein DTO271G3_2703 [Paecilomyces variotii]|nr:hypothetical protein DTO271G3_2703 [Paecilomyces variotii]